jgi:hypothetical protein
MRKISRKKGPVTSKVVSYDGITFKSGLEKYMYKALKDIYDINNNDLMRNYYLITANLFKIIYTNVYDFEYKLYYEEESDHEKAKTVNDEGVVILTHYWKDKAIPQTIDLSI